MTPDTEVRYLKGVGERRAAALARLDIHTLADLLHHYPVRYEDRRQVSAIMELQPGQSGCIEATVASDPRLSRIRRGLDLVKLRAVDDSGSVEITYFNQSYLQKQLHCGEDYFIYGTMEGSLTRRTMSNPVMERAAAPAELTRRVVPVYRLTRGISNQFMLRAEAAALTQCDALPDILPIEIRRSHGLCTAGYAYQNVHQPADDKALAIARRRLAFEESFGFSCAIEQLRTRRRGESGRVLRDTDLTEFYAGLPFAPTAAQKRAVSEAVADMAGGQVMNRLVQGDVGSGKTLVAAALLYLAHRNGFQSAFMAPTEILASQHLQTLEAFLAPHGIRVGLLTGSLRAKERRETLAQLRDGVIHVAVGTHALLTEDVEFQSLSLVVTDEQHRFGVNQRATLSEKGERPHVLIMSATPIPRTLSLLIYGDLDVSVLDELPPGRQTVETFAIGEDKRERLYGFMEKQVREHHQVFVVCPRVEEDEEDALPELKSAAEHAAALQQRFPDLRVGCIHGRMKPREKDAVMTAMAAGELDILVATTVVEVGVDVPNATLMVVENAERFGLSQLHQLRGRVGRGEAKSWCILVSEDAGGNTTAAQRLSVLCRSNDGFRIAEEDLRLRGPGEFLGSRQSGAADSHLSVLGGDMALLQEARDAAAALLERDPELSRPEHRALREYVCTLLESREGTMN